MAIVAVSPIRITGSWNDGFALDRHTISSVPTGDPYHWDTTRTELGQLVYQLKYLGDRNALESIVDTAGDFLKNRWEGLLPVDGLVPVPPSVSSRNFQPAVEIGQALASRLKIPFRTDLIAKISVTPQMKNVGDWAERRQMLRQAIQKGPGSFEGKTALVFDDLVESGSTLGRVTDVLRSMGASEVYALALTKTR